MFIFLAIQAGIHSNAVIVGPGQHATVFRTTFLYICQAMFMVCVSQALEFRGRQALIVDPKLSSKSLTFQKRFL